MKKSRLLGAVCTCVIFPNAELKKSGFTLLALLMLAGLGSQPVFAVDREYDPTLPSCTNTFADTNCWFGGVVPGAGENAVFNTNAISPYTINFTAPITNLNATINDDNLVWDLGTNTYSLTHYLTVGDAIYDYANLEIQNGSVSSGSGRIGNDAGSYGTATVSGAGSSWTNSSSLNVGYAGTGFLSIDSGGSVSNSYGYLGYLAGGYGSATVSGTDSSWTNSSSLFVGYAGTGYLNIYSGGSVSNTIGYLGNLAGGYGSAYVSGTGSSWTNSSSLSVGNSGTGYLRIYSGGSVSDSGGSLGSYAGGSGTVTVSGAGSSWTNTSGLTVGFAGTGYLKIDSGGQVSNSYGYLGSSAGGSGTVTVSGAGSSWTNSSSLIVGSSGTGSLNIDSGGQVSNTIGYLGMDSGGSGTATVTNGGAWTNTDSLHLGGYSTVAGGTGVLNVNTGGSVDVTNLMTVWTGGIVNLTGGVINTGSLQSEGSINVNAGSLNISTDFTTSNTSNIVLNGLGNLSVSGTTTLNDASMFTLAGGTFSTGSLVNNGGFTFNSGTFNLTSDNLTIGSGGLFGNLAQFDYGKVMNVTSATTVNSGSILALNDGTFSSGSITNNGDIVLGGGLSRLGGALTNNSLLEGSGRVDAQVTNNNGSEIRVASGESMRFTSTGNTNAGRIEVIGGEIEFDQNLVNQGGSGNIVGRDATMRFNGGLDNQGSLGLSFGISDIFGDINNTGAVVISGGGNATFYDDYTNNGVTQTSAGSNAVFFGSVTGGGAYTGTGTLFFEGDLAPGNSPGLVPIGGNMNLGFGLTTIMEVAGITRGVEYDAFDVAGDLSLSGILDIHLLDMFAPSNGDYFDLFAAENITGDFISLLFPELTGGLAWDLAIYEDTNGSTDVLRLSVTSVPLPAAVWLFGSGLVGLIGIARRKQS